MCFFHPMSQSKINEARSIDAHLFVHYFVCRLGSVLKTNCQTLLGFRLIKEPFSMLYSEFYLSFSFRSFCFTKLLIIFQHEILKVSKKIGISRNIIMSHELECLQASFIYRCALYGFAFYIQSSH